MLRNVAAGKVLQNLYLVTVLVTWFGPMQYHGSHGSCCGADLATPATVHRCAPHLCRQSFLIYIMVADSRSLYTSRWLVGESGDVECES